MMCLLNRPGTELLRVYSEPKRRELEALLRKQEMGKQKSDDNTESLKLVKTYLTDQEHKRLRHAAAELDMNIQDYLKFALLKSIDDTLREYLDREFQKRQAGEEQ